MTRFCTTRRRAGGFSLIEVAIAVFVIVILLGSIFVPLTTQVEQRQVSDTEKTLNEVRDALTGFAVLNGYLPCPDTGTNGLENVNAASGQCATISGGVACGRLPHATLGLARSDVWGNRYTYCVNERFARRAPAAPFDLGSGGTDIRICTNQSCTTTLSTTAVLAVLSHGRNGYGATNLNTGAQNPASPSADEQENYDSDRDLVSRVHTAAGAGAGEFDDIVVWLPRYTLFNRMVAAGKLP
ncbi:MAG TPA: prepilin-type N-terminal cleavage/methylation domain-containing protein [Burkholderiales bacterium]|nr:prepilin-type N-terminal cleavage/methylation domain-containing protein [Burkholderiales bacterium]